MPEHEEIKKIYDQQITVFVWQNAPWANLLTGNEHFGHASMDVRDYSNREIYMYISWWPGYEGKGYRSPSCYREDLRGEISDTTHEKLENMIYAPKGNQILLNPSFNDNLNSANKLEKTAGTGIQLLNSAFIGNVSQVYGTKEDTRTSLPVLYDNGYWGLNGYRIAEWWGKKKKEDQYRIVSTTENCAGTVVEGLIAGGAEGYCPAPKKLIVMLPQNVSDWMIVLSRCINYLNSSMKSALNIQPSFRGKKLQVPVCDLESYDFKGVFGSGKNPYWQKFQKILQSIDTYRKFRWASDYAKKLESLIQIFDASHTLLSGNSDSPYSHLLKSIINSTVATLRSPDVAKISSAQNSSLGEVLLKNGGRKEAVSVEATDENSRKYRDKKRKDHQTYQKYIQMQNKKINKPI